MIHLKTREEIATMAVGGKKLRSVVKKLLPLITVGKTTLDIDKEAERLIVAEGGYPSFKTVKGYRWSTCLPINAQVVHTPPSERVIQDGDIFTLDIGILYKGFHTDWATTIIVGKPKSEKHVAFLNAGKNALRRALEKVKVDARIGEVSQVIEAEIYGKGYKILRDLTGHGVGRHLHEDPHVPGYLDRPVEKTIVMQSGLAIAVEVIYSESSEEIDYEDTNNWSVITKDRSMSACFEETMVVTDDNSFILT